MTENTDEFFERMEAEDAIDAAQAGLTKLTPREYAKAKGLQPQLVYYYIRQGKILKETCVCGRTVVDIESADKFLESKAQKKEEVSRSHLDADTE